MIRMIKSRLRLVIAVILLVISLAALAWGFLPGSRVIRRQKIQPTEMMLPTPASVLPSIDYMAEISIFNGAVCNIHGADRFIL